MTSSLLPCLSLLGVFALTVSGCNNNVPASATTPAPNAAASVTAPVAPAAETGELPAVTVGRTTVAWTPADGLTLAFDNVPVVRGSRLRVLAGDKAVLDAESSPAKVSGWEDGADGAKKATITLAGEETTAVLAFSVLPSGDVTVAATCQRADGAHLPATIHYTAGLLSGTVTQGASLEYRAGSGGTVRRVIPVLPPRVATPGPETTLTPSFDALSLETRLGRLSVAFSGAGGLPSLVDARTFREDWAIRFPVLRVGTTLAGETLAPAAERTMTYTFAIRPGDVPPPVEVKTASAAKPYLAADAVGSARSPLPPPLPRAAGEGSRNGGRMPSGGAKPTQAATTSGSPLPQRGGVGLTLPSPSLIPRPKKVAGLENPPFYINANTRIVVPDRATAEDQRAATLLKREILARVGLDLTAVPASQAPATNVILLGGAASNAKIWPLLSAKQVPSIPQNPEGYALAVRPDFVAIAGRDSRGAFWGAQTFLQLLMKSNKGPLVHPAVIEDWPTLTFRAAHLFYGKDALPFHKDLLDRVLARFKMNALFLQVEQVKWKHDPTVAPGWAGTPEQIKEEVAYAKDRNIEVYPLLQSYGHLGAVLNTPKNKAFAEDPQSPYALCVTDPQALKYWDGFVNEADETFDAPGFHVGLDEVNHKGKGRYPYRSAPKTLPQLMNGAAEHWKWFLGRRGKRMFMWADMALYPGEVAPSWGTAPSAADAAQVRQLLPKDITLIDWQYGEQTKFPSLNQLKSAGFRNIMGATWYRPKNIPNFTKAVVSAGGQGMIQTTWCGYESNASVLSTAERRQFTALVLAADYFWNGGDGPAPDKVGYDPAAVFTKVWENPNAVPEVGGSGSQKVAQANSGKTLPLTPTPHSLLPTPSTRGGIVYDLSGLGTVPLPDALGYGKDNAPARLPTGPVRLSDGALYRFGTKAILLAGRLNPGGRAYPVRIPLPVPTTFPMQEFRLALAASHRAVPGTKVGTLRIARQDGSEENIELVYGTNIAAPDDETAPTGDAPLLWRGRTGLGQPYLIRGLRYANTQRSPITSLMLSSVTADAAPLVYGMTVVTQAGQ